MKSILKLSEVNRAQVGPRELKNPRSKEYAIQTLYALKRYAESLRCDQELIEKELAEIEKYRHWEVLGYPSKDAMLAAELNKQGFSRVQALAANPAPILNDGPPTAEEKSLIFNNVKDRGVGNSAKYLTARIARDHPDILKRMQRGEYKSVRAAAIDAGIVKPDSPLVLLKRAWARASQSEQEEFTEWIKREIRV